MKKMTFLRLMEGINKEFPENDQHICNAAEKFLRKRGEKIPAKYIDDNFENEFYFKSNHPEFYHWIMRIGEKSRKNNPLIPEFIWGRAWRYLPSVKVSIFKKKLIQLRKQNERRNKKRIL